MTINFTININNVIIYLQHFVAFTWAKVYGGMNSWKKRQSITELNSSISWIP